jgi:hypothetical protein
MKRVLIKEIERQKELMNVKEQIMVPNLLNLFDISRYFKQDDSTSKSTPSATPQYKVGSFEEMASTVIDKLEGGYYHPEKHKSRAMGDSGETMMGIDRKHGGDINTSSEGKEFWSLIDKADAKNKWEWNYKGGPLESKLRNLVVRMIKPRFDSYSKRYLDPQAREIVMKSPGLMFHFIYAVWNGPGWFRKFADKINEKVRKGVKDPKELYMTALRSRTNSGNRIIAQSGTKIDDILGTNVV